MKRLTALAFGLLVSTSLTSCAGLAPGDATGVKPLVVYPVTSNDTPYSQCLRKLQTVPADNLPVFAVGEVRLQTAVLPNHASYSGGAPMSTTFVDSLMPSFFGSGVPE